MKTLYEYAYVLNVLSDDHPGIVAAVCGAVRAREGNIDACSETVVWGYFTQIMIVSFREPIGEGQLERAIETSGDEPGRRQVVVQRYAPEVASRPAGDFERYVVTLLGRDCPGIVWRMTQYLAGKDINIIDLYSERRGDDLVLIGQLEIPRHWEVATLQAEMDELLAGDGFTVRLQHEGVFVATNQLRLRGR